MNKYSVFTEHAVTQSLIDDLNGALDSFDDKPEMMPGAGVPAQPDDTVRVPPASFLDPATWMMDPDEPEADPDDPADPNTGPEDGIELIAGLIDGVLTIEHDCWAPLSTTDATVLGFSPEELEAANSAIHELNAYDAALEGIGTPTTICREDAVSFIATATVTRPLPAIGALLRAAWRLFQQVRKLWKYLSKSKNSVRRIRKAVRGRKAGTMAPNVARAVILKEAGRLSVALGVIATDIIEGRDLINELRAKGDDAQADRKQMELDKIEKQFKDLQERLKKLQKDEGISDQELDKAREQGDKEEAQERK